MEDFNFSFRQNDSSDDEFKNKSIADMSLLKTNLESKITELETKIQEASNNEDFDVAEQLNLDYEKAKNQLETIEKILKLNDDFEHNEPNEEYSEVPLDQSQHHGNLYDSSDDTPESTENKSPEEQSPKQDEDQSPKNDDEQSPNEEDASSDKQVCVFDLMYHNLGTRRLNN